MPPIPPAKPAGQPYVEIIEQPSSKSTRFRYECEGRSAGSLLGRSWTPECKTYPSIKIHNHSGACVVVVSLVTEDEPGKPHPHALVGGDCKQDVCTKKVRNSQDVIPFPNLGIQCKKKNQVAQSLLLRQQIRVDPFRTGFAHKDKPEVNNIDLTVVRLCFQVFLPDQTGKYQKALKPVCSDPIYDKKAVGELTISAFLPTSCSVKGGESMILLTGKLPKDEFEVRFFEGNDEKPVWEGFATFTAKDIHQQVAVKVKIPQYTNSANTRQKKQVQIMLRRKGKHDECSPAVKFFYLAEGQSNMDKPRKRLGELSDTEDIKKPKLETFPDFSNEDLPAVLPSLESNPSYASSFPSGNSSGLTSMEQVCGEMSTGAHNFVQVYQTQSQYLYPISGEDKWMTLRGSDITIQAENGTYFVYPGPTAPNQAAAPKPMNDIPDDMMNKLIQMSKNDPNSELNLPFALSAHFSDIFNVSEFNLDSTEIVTQNDSSSLTRDLRLINGMDQ